MLFSCGLARGSNWRPRSFRTSFAPPPRRPAAEARISLVLFARFGTRSGFLSAPGFSQRALALASPPYFFFFSPYVLRVGMDDSGRHLVFSVSLLLPFIADAAAMLVLLAHLSFGVCWPALKSGHGTFARWLLSLIRAPAIVSGCLCFPLVVIAVPALPLGRLLVGTVLGLPTLAVSRLSV